MSIKRDAILVPLTTFDSTRAVLADIERSCDNSRTRDRTYGVFEFPINPLFSASLTAVSMIAFISSLGIANLAGTGFANKIPELIGNVKCASTERNST